MATNDQTFNPATAGNTNGDTATGKTPMTCPACGQQLEPGNAESTADQFAQWATANLNQATLNLSNTEG